MPVRWAGIAVLLTLGAFGCTACQVGRDPNCFREAAFVQTWRAWPQKEATARGSGLVG